MPKIGGFSFSSVPRPRAPLRRRRRPVRAFFYRLWAVFMARDHVNLVAFGFTAQRHRRLAINDPLAQLGGHLVRLRRGQTQFCTDLAVGQIQAHEVRTQHPNAKRLVMARKDRSGQIIKATTTAVAAIALAIDFLSVMAIFNDLMRFAMGTANAS